MNSCGSGINVDLAEIVNDVKVHFFDSDYLGATKQVGPGSSVVVAPHDSYWGDAAEFVEDGRIADIARVDDVV